MDTIFDRVSLICLLEDAVPQVLEFFGDLIGRAAEPDACIVSIVSIA
jgi:hypothetical protein